MTTAPPTRDEIHEWLDSLSNVHGLLPPVTDAVPTSRFAAFREYAIREAMDGRDLRALVDWSPRYLRHVLRPATECVTALGLTVAYDLPLATLALVRVVHEAAGLTLWLTQPKSASESERAMRFVRAAAKEHESLKRVSKDMGDSSTEVARSELLPASDTLDTWHAWLGPQSKESFPTLRSLFKYAVPEDEWLAGFTSSAIHSNAFAVWVASEAARAKAGFFSGLALDAGHSYLRAIRSCAEFVMAERTAGSPLGLRLAELENASP